MLQTSSQIALPALGSGLLVAMVLAMAGIAVSSKKAKKRLLT